ncbi:MAG: hypothetical protein WC994_07410 [Brumimicrobium sp.]
MKKPTTIRALFFLFIFPFLTICCTKCGLGSSDAEKVFHFDSEDISPGYRMEIMDGVYAGTTFFKKYKNEICKDSYLISSDGTDSPKNEIYLLIKNDSVSPHYSLFVVGIFIIDSSSGQPYSFSHQMEEFNEPALTIYIVPNIHSFANTLTLTSHKGNLKIYDIRTKSSLFYPDKLEFHASFEGKFIDVSDLSKKDTIQINGEFHF